MKAIQLIALRMRLLQNVIVETKNILSIYLLLILSLGSGISVNISIDWFFCYQSCCRNKSIKKEIKTLVNIVRF